MAMAMEFGTNGSTQATSQKCPHVYVTYKITHLQKDIQNFFFLPTNYGLN